MARKILAGTLLAVVALALGLTVGVQFGDPAEATVSQFYVGNQNAGNYAEILSDTTGATHPDSLSFDCDRIYKWSIACATQSVLYRFKIAGTDSVTNWGYVYATLSLPQTWEVAPAWIDIKSASGTARYTVCVQGWDAGEAGNVGAISDTQHVY